MFIKVKSYMNGEAIIVNAGQIVRVHETKEHTGSVIVLPNNHKLMVTHTLDDIFSILGSPEYDLTEASEE